MPDFAQRADLDRSPPAIRLKHALIDVGAPDPQHRDRQVDIPGCALQGVVVELDGRAFHESPRDRDRDAVRELAESSRSDLVTTRVTYQLVFGDACRTARLIGLSSRDRSNGLIPRTRCVRSTR